MSDLGAGLTPRPETFEEAAFGVLTALWKAQRMAEEQDYELSAEQATALLHKFISEALEMTYADGLRSGIRAGWELAPIARELDA